MNANASGELGEPDSQHAIPLTAHVLYPHHIGALSILIIYLRGITLPSHEYPARHLSYKVKLRILRVLAREMAEVREPTPYMDLVHSIVHDPTRTFGVGDELKVLRDLLYRMPNHICRGVTTLSDLFADLRTFVIALDDPSDDSPLERRSLFGMYVRRCCLTYRKISFAGTIRLMTDFQKWALGDSRAGYDYERTGKGRANRILMFPVYHDKRSSAKLLYFEKYQAALKTGDPNVAAENLRRFFDQHFRNEHRDSVLSQHALLNLAQLHYSQGEFRAAKQFLDEAIKIAREKNDTEALDSCQSLMQRIAPGSGAVFLSRDRDATVKAGISPLDILWDIKRLIDMGEPLHLGFTKVVESMGVWDAGIKSNIGAAKWAKHAVLAVLWRLAGVESLAACHESIVIAFTKPGDDESRMTAICGRAARLTSQGHKDHALALLLDIDTWRDMTFRQYSLWALEVWNVFAFTASRIGQTSVYRDFLHAKRPSPPPPVQSLPSDFTQEPRGVITESLSLALRLKEGGQAVQALNPLMDAIWSAEFRGMYKYYRIAVVLLADIGLDLGMGPSACGLIEEVLPQVLLGDDLELRAYAGFTYARCMLALAGPVTEDPPQPEQQPRRQTMMEAALFLMNAARDYSLISKFDKQLEANYLLSVVWHNCKIYTKRDEAAWRFKEVEKLRRKMLEAEIPALTKEVFDFLTTEVPYIVGLQPDESS